MSDSFKSLKLYEELSMVVVRAFKLIETLDDFETGYGFLVDGLRTELAESLPRLADGYNLYHYDDKAEAYRDVRTRVSRAQSLLMLLNDLGIFNNEPVNDVCRGFEACVSHLNGLIRRMEDYEG